MLKSLSNVVLNLSSNTDIQELLVKSEFIPVIKHFSYLVEYEVLTNIYLAIGNFILSPKENMRKRSVDLGLLDLI